MGALQGLENNDPSVRVRAAMAVGTSPDPEFVDALIGRCAIEPDFHVREMLTWALLRHPAPATVPKLVAELRSGRAQARSQALHTLSKIGDRQAWPAITRELLTDPDDEIAKAAWRAAVALVPGGSEADLAAVLATQFGRGGLATRLSLSRAMIGLGEAILPVLHTAAADPDPRFSGHAAATERLLRDPEAGFEPAIEAANRVVAFGTKRAKG
jgi:HEAT repeat protein